MAKRSKLGFDVIVDDKGSLKNTGKKAKKTAGQFDVLSQSSRQADRAGKGLARTSSNSTKNFSKMSQGISGGLVPAYAVMAANIFALSAAFRFLQASMETRNMIEGQKAFGAITGIAFQSITTSIQDATEGMLEFKDAAEAAAIGTAAGLSADALTKLGTAARDVSLALGRDLADSFQRLIRGVTKAEPELLDELGIVLRLENATRKYALMVGKTKDELNAFERTQAVLNDVLEQADRKFGRITEIMDPDAFAFAQITKDMDDMLVSFKKGLAETLIPILMFLKENFLVLVGVIAAVLIPILKAIGPNFAAMAATARVSMATFTTSMITAETSILAFRASMGLTGQALGKFAQRARAASLLNLDELFAGEGIFAADKAEMESGQTSFDFRDQLDQKEIDNLRGRIETKKGMVKDMSISQRIFASSQLDIQQATLITNLQKGDKLQDTFSNRHKLRVLRFNLWHKTQTLKMFNWLETKQEMLMANLGKIQLAFMLMIGAQLLWSLGKWAVGKMTPESVKERREEMDKLNDSLKALNTELDRMNKVRAMGLLGIKDGVEQLGGALQSVDLVKTIRDYNLAVEAGYMEEESSLLIGDNIRSKKAQKRFKELGQQLEEMDDRFKGTKDRLSVTELFEKGETLDTREGPGKFYNDLASSIMNATDASKRFEENQQNVKKSIDSTIRSISKLPYQNLVESLSISLEAMDKTHPERQGQLKQQIERQTLLRGYGTTEVERRAAYEELRGERAGQIRGGQWLDKRTDEQKMLAKKDFEGFNRFVTKGLKLIDEEIIKEEEKGLLYVTQHYFREALLDIQKESLAFQITEINNNLKLAQAGPGSSVAVQKAKVRNTLDKQWAKQNDAIIENQLAGASLATAKEQIFDQIKIENLGKIDAARDAGVDTTNKQWRLDNLVALEITDQHRKQKGALKSALKAEKVSSDTLTLEIEKTNNAEIQHNWDLEAIRLAQWQMQLSYAELAIQREINAEKRKAADPSLYGFAKTAAAKVAERASLVGAKQKASGKAGMAAQELLSYGFTKNEVLRPTSIDTSTISDMDQRDKAATALTTLLTEQEKVLGFKQQILDLDNRGYYVATNLLAAENERLLIESQRITQIRPAEVIFHRARMAHLEAEGNLNEFNWVETMRLSREQAEFNRKNDLNDMEREHNKFMLQTRRIYSISPAEDRYQTMLWEWKQVHGDADEATIARLKKMAIEQEGLNIDMQLMKGIQDTLGQGFKDMFLAMVDGTEKFKDAMKKLFIDFMQKMANMLAEAVALNLMMRFTGGVFQGSTWGAGGRSGGVFKSPGYKSFAGGGIATGPSSGYAATLHGSEAVVPLGNDLAIPVKFETGGPNVSNITVNVAAGGQQQTTTSKAGERERKLGQMIALAVQGEILDQQRPGGILSPYGDGSI